MATGLDLITLALRLVGVNGVGQAPSADDVQDCLLSLNGMLNQWAARRWLTFHTLDLPLQSTGAASYTIGPTGDFVCARPDRIEDAYVRFNAGTTNTIDYRLALIPSREDWDGIAVKSMGALPAAVFHDSSYPLGTLYFWPVANSKCELHVVVKAPLLTVTDLTAQIALPDEYFDALLYNLAVRIAPLYQLAPRPDVLGLANAALATLRASNVQIASLQMPYALTSTRRSGAAVLSAGYDYLASSGVLSASSVAGLPTSLPSTPGQLWNNGGVLCVS